MYNIREFATKQKWILTELKYLNMLASVGALSFFSDALQSKMGTIFISRTSGKNIAINVSALFLGQAIMTSTGYVIVQGIAVGMSTLCSQAYGAANYKLMGTYFMRALIIASLSRFPVWTLWISVKPVIYYISRNHELAQGAGAYTTLLCFSYPAYIYSRLTCSFLQSQNIVFPTLATQLSGNFLNICLQYVFVVVLGLEIKGVALSFLFSTNLISVLTFCYIRCTNVHLAFATLSWSYLSQWGHFFKYGMNGTIVLLIGIIEARIVPILFIGLVLREKSQLALLGILNVFWVLFISLSLGLAVGANIRVGNLLGEGNLVRAKRSIIVIACFVLCVEIGFGVTIVSFSHYIPYLFTPVQDMREQIQFGIRVMGLVVVSDVSIILRGIGNACCLQNVTIAIKFVCTFLITMPFGCLVAYFVTWKAAGFYMMIGVRSLACAIMFLVLLYLCNWQKIVKNVQQNTQRSRFSECSESSGLFTNDTSIYEAEIRRRTKWFLISRYTLILSTSVMLFAFVCYFSVYLNKD